MLWINSMIKWIKSLNMYLSEEQKDIWTKIFSWGLFGGGGAKVFLKLLYLNNYVELNSKNSCVVSLHDYP